MIEYIKQLKELEAMELVDCAKQGRIKRAKEIIGQENNDALASAGDSMAKISRAVKYALYKDSDSKMPIYYVPVLVLDDEVAFCIKVY